MSEAFRAEHEAVEEKLASELSQKWGRAITSKFEQAFPEWEATVEITRVSMKPWHEDDYFQVSIGIAPSSRHPDKEWLYELDVTVGREMDRWFNQEFGLLPSFTDTALDMARGVHAEFPAYNGVSIRVYW